MLHRKAPYDADVTREHADLDPDDPRHGTSNAYGNLRCRCPRCREANRVSHQAYIEQAKSEGRKLGQHGSSLCYDTGCRCDACREAHNRRSREKKQARRQRDLEVGGGHEP